MPQIKFAAPLIEFLLETERLEKEGKLPWKKSCKGVPSEEEIEKHFLRPFNKKMAEEIKKKVKEHERRTKRKRT
jgi:hypothetical protein